MPNVVRRAGSLKRAINFTGMLESKERERLTDALEMWLIRHPDPDEPAFRVSRTGELTPREVVEAVTLQSELGEAVLEILEFSVRRSSLEEVTSNFESGSFAER
jgi:hypothetical protein